MEMEGKKERKEELKAIESLGYVGRGVRRQQNPTTWDLHTRMYRRMRHVGETGFCPPLPHEIL